MKTNELFCKENVEKIIVPDVVRDDLLSIIEEKLKRAGFYYRIAYRVKAVDSMVDKLIYKDYGRAGTENADKKMQDLIGIRILLYFCDDREICMRLLDNLFAEPGKWETTENNEYEFRAIKVNGIFKLPAYLSKTIVNPMLSDYVDDTFEVQVRTNSFEGWHEIEHDLRYKGSVFGIGNEVLARKMNSILATLELCDDSIVQLLEDLGHQHYKDKKWTDMVRCHYRLKLDNSPMSDELREVLDSDTELAKGFYKFKRGAAIAQLWNDTSEKGIELTVDNIIRVVNQAGPNDERLNNAFALIDKKKNQENEVANRRKRFEPFKPLSTFMVFQARTYLDTSRQSDKEVFIKAAAYIYSWVRSRFIEVFPDIKENIASYTGIRLGYSVEVDYNEEQCVFMERTTHPDTRVSSRIWQSVAALHIDENGLRFTVTNEYAEPEERYRDTENVMFSRPNFYGEIADNIGVCDVERLREAVTYIKPSNLDKMYQLIESTDRMFPVVVFMAEDTEWTAKFDLGYFSYLVGYYAHVMFVVDEAADEFAQKYKLQAGYENSITVFYPGEPPKTSYQSDIMEARFEVIKLNQKKYWNENGCRAYRRQLVSEIRQKNVSLHKI